MTKIEGLRDYAHRQPDVDYEKHVFNLHKKHLKVADWLLEPLQNPDNNFIDPIIAEYTNDIEIRNSAAEN